MVLHPYKEDQWVVMFADGSLEMQVDSVIENAIAKRVHSDAQFEKYFRRTVKGAGYVKLSLVILPMIGCTIM